MTGGGESILEFERWLETGDAAILEGIERYNEEDCRSTLRLREWLLERALKRSRDFGTDPLATAAECGRSDSGSQSTFACRARGRCWKWPAKPDADSAGLLSPTSSTYHRREAKPAWWAYYRPQASRSTSCCSTPRPLPASSPVGAGRVGDSNRSSTRAGSISRNTS